jgi:meso-butanediol dehydrogenase / (S,S)-butanediol dehydrogenase / diacetyl reductase
MGETKPRFSGAAVIVTGAGHGIGAACAVRLAAEGASVALLDLDAEAAQQVAGSLPSDGGTQHVGIGLDVTEATAVPEVVAAVEHRFGRLDALVNVAGGGMAEPAFEEGEDEVFERMWRLNFLSVVRMCRATVPLLRQSDRAAIVTVSSVNGLIALGSEAYSSAKAALTSLTTNLAIRYAPEIRVNAVAPGTTRTRVWDHQGGADRLASLYPLGRVGEPEDMAAAVAFLASSDAAWITGHTLPVDGGLTVRGVPGFGT